MAKNMTNGTFLTYYNPDLGIKIEYPSGWKKAEDNLRLHTFVAFTLTYQSKFDFHNITLAEIDLRAYPLLLPPASNSHPANKLAINQINTRNETIVGYSKTTIGGLPALAIVSYYHGGNTVSKEMQLWTTLPNRHAMLEIIYIPSKLTYYTFLPILEHMVGSLKIN